MWRSIFALTLMIPVLAPATALAKGPVSAASKSRAAELSRASKAVVDETLGGLAEEEQYDIRKLIPGGITSHLKTADIERSGPMASVGAGAPNVQAFSEIPVEAQETVEDLERIIGQINVLPIGFLEGGVSSQRAVGRVILKANHQVDGELFFPGDGWGTGFLVSDTILMTNNHVLPSKGFAKNKARIQFNFQRSPTGEILDTEEFDLDPDSLFHTNKPLDYTLVRVIPRTEPGENPDDPEVEITPGSEWGHLIMTKEPLLFVPEEGSSEPRQRLSIIQHPQGRMKEIALHDNFIVRLSTDLVNYTTDTEPGSSGSPVFNVFWQLTALHHAGGDKTVVDGQTVWLNNEGIRMDRIVNDLEAALADQPTVLEELGLETN